MEKQSEKLIPYLAVFLSLPHDSAKRILGHEKVSTSLHADDVTKAIRQR